MVMFTTAAEMSAPVNVGGSRKSIAAGRLPPRHRDGTHRSIAEKTMGMPCFYQ